MAHATSFRSLVKALHQEENSVTFFERDVKWYAGNRNLPRPDFCNLILYHQIEELRNYKNIITNADLVIVGSYVPEGIEVGHWVLKNSKGIKAFYDIDTPVTLANVDNKKCDYIDHQLISRYDIYLTLTDGPYLNHLEEKYLSPNSVLFPCSVDPELYYPERSEKKWDLGYIGTYSKDRQPILEKILVKAALQWPEGKFVVAGSLYPKDIKWPGNIERIEHLSPRHHRQFYNQQRFTLNLTRRNIIHYLS